MKRFSYHSLLTFLATILFSFLLRASAREDRLDENPKPEYLSGIFHEIVIDYHLGWGILGIDITARHDRRSKELPLRIGDRTYQKGVGHHTDGKIRAQY